MTQLKLNFGFTTCGTSFEQSTRDINEVDYSDDVSKVIHVIKKIKKTRENEQKTKRNIYSVDATRTLNF